jgi:hypothetical protein
LDRLYDAERDHDAAIRSSRSGVSDARLAEDLLRWRRLGSAIADLARLVGDHCAASAFCDTRPRTDVLASRLVEAIDDQIDEAAWRVVEARARLEAAG